MGAMSEEEVKMREEERKKKKRERKEVEWKPQASHGVRLVHIRIV